MYTSFNSYTSMGEEERFNIPRYHSNIKPAQWQKPSEQIVTIYDLDVICLLLRRVSLNCHQHPLPLHELFRSVHDAGQHGHMRTNSYPSSFYLLLYAAQGRLAMANIHHNTAPRRPAGKLSLSFISGNDRLGRRRAGKTHHHMSNNHAREGIPFPSVSSVIGGRHGRNDVWLKGMHAACRIPIDTGHWAMGVTMVLERCYFS